MDSEFLFPSLYFVLLHILWKKEDFFFHIDCTLMNTDFVNIIDDTT